MVDLSHYTSFPIGSLINQPKAVSDRYISELRSLPTNLRGILLSPRTAAYVRGTVKSHDLPIEKTSQLAFMLLQLIFGELALTQLSIALVNQFKLPADKAQILAREIEKELFAPIMLEYNEFINNKKKAAPPTVPPHESGARNVLDLKSQRPVPPPPPIPRN